MTRYTIDFGKDIDQLLADLAERKKTSKAEIIRRAIASYSYLDKETGPQKQKKVSITDEQDNVLKDIVLP